MEVTTMELLKLTKSESAKLPRTHVHPRMTKKEVNFYRQQFPEVDINYALTRFTYQRRHAEVIRGVKFEMSFEQWLQLWLDSGHWDKRGRGAENYCLARNKDEGAYAVDNVYIATNSQNIKDRYINKKLV
jgi:hypothetical protein